MVCGVCDSQSEAKTVNGVRVVLKDYNERRTTDGLFLIILIAAWVAMTIIGITSGKNGDPKLLIAPYSDDGSICGYSANVLNKPYLFYVSGGLGVCQESCPSYAIGTAPLKTATPVIENYVCLTWFTTEMSAYPSATFASLIQSNPLCWDSTTNQFQNSNLACPCNIKYDSKSLFNRCAMVVNLSGVDSENPTSKDQLKMFFSDVITARAIIFGFGFGIALGVAFLFTYLMSKKCLAGILIWSCVLGVLGFGIAVVAKGTQIFNNWKVDPSHSANELKTLRAFNITFAVLSIVWFLLMCAFYKAINMAIKCVSMGADAINEMQMMVFIPFLQIGGFVLFLIPMIYYCLFIASDGTFTPYFGTVTFGTKTIPNVLLYRTYEVDHSNKSGAKFGFLFFVMLWTMNFIANLGSMVIAHAVATWYFTQPKDRAAAINNRNILSSYKLVLRFHMGTVAFGSLLIAIIQYARAVALYMQRKVSKNFLQKTWVKIACCCMHTCLCCLECCMKFISRNAYIQSAIYGTPFCESAKNSFVMIAQNMMRIGAILVTSEGALFIGKCFTTVVATGASYLYLVNYYKTPGHAIYSPAGPSILVAIISWMTATMFMDVLHMSIDTVFHCFIADETSNNGKAVFAGAGIGKFVDDHGKLEHEDGNHCCGTSDPHSANTGVQMATKM